MALTCGFFNSVDGDRKYDATQFASLFDGVITDGVVAAVGDFFATTPGGGMVVNVGSGRAWFNRTWTYSDAKIPLTLDASDLLYDRIDAVVLEIDTSVAVRDNSIKVIKGTPAQEPQKPALTNEGDVHQYALAYVRVKASSVEIGAGDITINVGQADCPFVTSIVETPELEVLFAQWDAQFTAWFENVQSQLEGDIAANLQRQIDERVKISDKASDTEAVDSETNNKWMTPHGVGLAIGALAYKIGDMCLSIRNLEIEENGKYLFCNGRTLQTASYPDLYSKIKSDYGFIQGKLSYSFGSELTWQKSNQVLTSQYLVVAYKSAYNSSINISFYDRTTLSRVGNYSIIPSISGSSDLSDMGPLLEINDQVYIAIKRSRTASSDASNTEIHKLESSGSTVLQNFATSGNGQEYTIAYPLVRIARDNKIYCVMSYGGTSYSNTRLYYFEGDGLVKTYQKSLSSRLGGEQNTFSLGKTIYYKQSNAYYQVDVDTSANTLGNPSVVTNSSVKTFLDNARYDTGFSAVRLGDSDQILYVSSTSMANPTLSNLIIEMIYRSSDSSSPNLRRFSIVDNTGEYDSYTYLASFYAFMTEDENIYIMLGLASDGNANNAERGLLGVVSGSTIYLNTVLSSPSTRYGRYNDVCAIGYGKYNDGYVYQKTDRFKIPNSQFSIFSNGNSDIYIKAKG